MTTCAVCDAYATKRCKICHTLYCSKECQRDDWVATHRRDCGWADRLAKGPFADARAGGESLVQLAHRLKAARLTKLAHNPARGRVIKSAALIPAGTIVTIFVGSPREGSDMNREEERYYADGMLGDAAAEKLTIPHDFNHNFVSDPMRLKTLTALLAEGPSEAFVRQYCKDAKQSNLALLRVTDSTSCGVSTRIIRPGEELTGHYGISYWFVEFLYNKHVVWPEAILAGLPPLTAYQRFKALLSTVMLLTRGFPPRLVEAYRQGLDALRIYADADREKMIEIDTRMRIPNPLRHPCAAVPTFEMRALYCGVVGRECYPTKEEASDKKTIVLSGAWWDGGSMPSGSTTPAGSFLTLIIEGAGAVAAYLAPTIANEASQLRPVCINDLAPLFDIDTMFTASAVQRVYKESATHIIGGCLVDTKSAIEAMLTFGAA